MRRLLILFAAACGLAYGQPACVQIAQTLYQTGGARPVPMNGSITLSQGYTAQNGSFVVVQSQAPIQIVAGRLSVCLSPASYEADYTVNPVAPLNATVEFTRYWTVPLTGGPYKLTDIPAGATGPIEGQVFAPPMPQTYAVGATGATGATSTVPGPQGPTGAQGAAGVTGAVGPTGLSGTGNAPFDTAIPSSLTSYVVTAATHNQGLKPVGFCFDSPTPPQHPIACDYSIDSAGTVTFSWPGGFIGAVRVLGGGTGATGATGAQGVPGPTGPAGTIGVFGSAPTTVGVYCPQVTVTAGPSYAYGWASCSGALSYSVLSDAQYTAMTDSQYTAMTD